MIINSIDDLRAWASGIEASVGPGAAEILVEEFSGPGHPRFGTDWSEYLEDLRTWLLGHARYRLKEGGMAETYRAESCGRGVRILGPGGLDVIGFSFDDIDEILVQEYWKK